MLLTKITTMSKEKVHLREKVLAKGMIGLYLDYSVKGKRKRKLKKGRTKLYLDIYKGYEKKNGKTDILYTFTEY